MKAKQAFATWIRNHEPKTIPLYLIHTSSKYIAARMHKIAIQSIIKMIGK